MCPLLDECAARCAGSHRMGEHLLSLCRSAVHVALWDADLVYHALGTGDELAGAAAGRVQMHGASDQSLHLSVPSVAEVLSFIPSALHDVLKRSPTEAAVLENHARVSIALSEIVNEVRVIGVHRPTHSLIVADRWSNAQGTLDIADRASLLRALKLKVCACGFHLLWDS